MLENRTSRYQILAWVVACNGGYDLGHTFYKNDKIGKINHHPKTGEELLFFIIPLSAFRRAN